MSRYGIDAIVFPIIPLMLQTYYPLHIGIQKILTITWRSDLNAIYVKKM